MPYGQDPEIDMNRGAPWKVREAVGAAVTPQDRLLTIRKYYPDAQPMGEDNFVFVDPQTKRPTLYNPRGLDYGDIPSVTPEIAEGLGGVMGGAVAAPTLNPIAIGAGIGLGAAGGREVAEQLIKARRGTVDTRGLPQHLADTAVTGGTNMVAGPVTERVVGAGKRMLSPVFSTIRRVTGGTPAQLAQDAATVNVRLPAGAASGNRTIQSTEHMLAGTPGGAGVMQESAERTIQQMRNAADEASRNFGTPRSKQGAGEVLREGAQSAIQRYEGRAAELWGNAPGQGLYRHIQPDAPVSIQNGLGAINRITGEFAATPRLQERFTKNIAGIQEDLEADAANGQIPFSTLQRLRTQVGMMLKDPVNHSNVERVQLERLYGGLSEDIRAAAAARGPDALRAFETANRYTRFNMQRNISVLDKLLKSGDDEKAFKWAMEGSKEGGSRLRNLRRNYRPGEWGDVASTVVGQMGRAKPGAQNAAGDEFSINTFMTNFNTLSDEAKNALFGGTQLNVARRNLERLTRVGAALKDTDKMANPSGTARVAAYFTTLSALGGSVGNMLGGDYESTGAGAVVGAVVAPRIAARLITSPAFTSWLANSAQISSVSQWTQHLGRLAAIAKAEPEIRDEVRQYMDALRSAPKPQE